MIELYMKERGENMENKQKKSMITVASVVPDDLHSNTLAAYCSVA